VRGAHTCASVLWAPVLLLTDDARYRSLSGKGAFTTMQWAPFFFGKKACVQMRRRSDSKLFCWSISENLNAIQAFPTNVGDGHADRCDLGMQESRGTPLLYISIRIRSNLETKTASASQTNLQFWSLQFASNDLVANMPSVVPKSIPFYEPPENRFLFAWL